MARFQVELPNDLIKQVEAISKDTNRILGEMTRAGAEVVESQMKNNAPDILKSHIKLSKTYKTPSDGGVNTKVYVSGYIPFSDPNRKFFVRKDGSGKNVPTDKGVPADFLANLYGYGRSTAPFPKHPFVRKSFKKKEIEEAMEKKREQLIDELIRANGGST